MSDTKQRSLAKAISWRFFATIITSCVVFLFTGEFKFAMAVGLLDTLIKIFVYYFHERMWIKIPFGIKKNVGDYEI